MKKIRISTLWRVPVYCIVSGVVSYRLALYLVAFFGVEHLPGNVLQTNGVAIVVIHGLLFVAFLALGARLFRGMTRPELAVSVSIAVVIRLAVQLAIYRIPGITDDMKYRLNTWFYPACNEFFLRFLLRTGITNLSWPGFAADTLSLYLFVLFGRAGTFTAPKSRPTA